MVSVPQAAISFMAATSSGGGEDDLERDADDVGIGAELIDGGDA